MQQFSAFEAKNKLGTLLDCVARGETVLITRYGKVVARLGPAEGRFDQKSARRAADGLLRARRGISLGGFPLKELIEEGRR